MKFHKLMSRGLVAALALMIGAQAFAARTTTYFHNDGLGSVVAATNEAGSVLWRKDYAPFGEQIDETPDNERTSYTGKQHDDVTGLTYFGGRNFDPEIGRFVSIDPVAFVEDNAMSFNRYLYVNNNPYKYVDPDGEFLNFAAKFLVDVAINVAINYVTTGKMDVGGALKESAIGLLNPAKTLASAGKLAMALRKVDKVAPCPVSCFAAGTAILTESGYLPIEMVEVGTQVWAHDPETGEFGLKPVLNTFVNDKDSIWNLDIEKDGTIVRHHVTGTHPYFVLDGVGGGTWLQVSQLAVGATFTTADGGTAKLVAIEDTRQVTTTYNFEVADINTYYVSAAQVLVHNCKKTGGTIYLRVDKATGGEYVGKAKAGRYDKRQREHHVDNPGKQYEFHKLEEIPPGSNRRLDVAEEDWIRAGGGPGKAGGRLENDMYGLNDVDYRAAGGSIPKPTK